MGGIADYSGSLVLQLPTPDRGNLAFVARSPTDTGCEPHLCASSTCAEPASFALPIASLVECASPSDVRSALAAAAAPRWAMYALGVVGLLHAESWIDLGAEPGADLLLAIASNLPQGKGLASSASVEVAVAKACVAAFGAALDDKALALLCQRVENFVVGAPCGIMDQLACALGAPGALLAIVCRPAQIDGLVAIPPGLTVIDVDSGASHELADSGSAYTVVRAAAFIGAKLLGVSCLTADVTVAQLDALLPTLPETLEADGFVARFGSLDAHLDAGVTPLEAGVAYPVRASVAHAVREHQRVRLFRQLLATPVPAAETKALLGELMLASHASYTRLGLGSAATDAIVTRAVALPGVWGAKVTGGGGGGVVAILCDDHAVELVRSSFS
ncbi:uncharacterized protein AMSG_12092 [Thecamonas trahens ATCC 50062]|uniref:Galactokinase n=1 Tax=Thecamonas trahens ATCC 50062 TaxID=461836 RepID=A0A0L0DHG7_THETB|nr:hypothetical protein AMSG_12092 [Thecamonas trahens ATCC 50062]KNC51650.1 hypothetical protein AMSG_12092 [Thecamonas trahens ATCC 50062]|eukprot:XP_013755893.1 hypothetical protein AMSG_12092 [Thecamonas trahens ATCC 50062]